MSTHERSCYTCELCGLWGGPSPPDYAVRLATGEIGYECRRTVRMVVDHVRSTTTDSRSYRMCDAERAPHRWWRRGDRCGPDGKHWQQRTTTQREKVMP